MTFERAAESASPGLASPCDACESTEDFLDDAFSTDGTVVLLVVVSVLPLQNPVKSEPHFVDAELGPFEPVTLLLRRRRARSEVAALSLFTLVAIVGK